MSLAEDPLSSLWFNLLVTLVSLALFVAAMYVLKKHAEREAEAETPEKKSTLTVY